MAAASAQARAATAAAVAARRGVGGSAQRPPRAARASLVPGGLPDELRNPQNCADPLVGPSTELSAEQAVCVQLDAMRNNNEPFANHGITTLYSFCEGAGGMELSRYFLGKSSSLYHLDHFMGKMSELPHLRDLLNYEVLSCEEVGQGEAARATVVARVLPHAKANVPPATYTFVLKRRDFGLCQGAWVTERVTFEADASS